MEISSAAELFRWAWNAVRRWLPQRILGLAWPKEKVLQHVHLVHFEQAPRFHIAPDREPAELSFAGYNLFNLTPLKLQIVAADLRICVYREDWIKYRERFPTPVMVAPLSRSGFPIEQSSLSASQVQRLREHSGDWMHIDIRGTVVLACIHGELRKDVHSTIAVIVDRGQPIRPRTEIPQLTA